METVFSASPDRGARVEQQTAKRRILVVDDDPTVTHLLAGLLRRRYEVASARNGADALAILASQAIDLVLLDITMPGMDGIAVCRVLKASSRTRDLPVIFLSGHTDDSLIVLGFEAGGVDYVTKPFDAAVLMARIETHLALRDSQAALARANRDLQEELSWAGELQRRLLAVELPMGGPALFSVAYEPLPDLHCGGDYFDVFNLAGGRRLAVLGDVSGHGLRAAFITVMLKSIIYRGYVKHHLGDLVLPDFVAWLNDRLCDELARLPGIFVALLAFTIDPATRCCVFCNAGQHPPYVLRGERIITVPRRGSSLGFNREMRWHTDEMTLESGDRIVAYTDGLVEIDGSPDVQRLADALRSYAASVFDASALIGAVKNRVGRSHFTDDATVMTVLVG